MKRFTLTLIILLSLVLASLAGGLVLADDPPEGNTTVNLTVEVVEPEPTPTPSKGVSMFRLYDLAIENITEDSADILWKTSRSTTSELTYWSSLELTIESDEYVKEHLVHLEELKEDTAYYFEVTCKDRYNLRKSVTGEFTTLKREVIPEPEEPEPEEPEVVEPEEEPTPPEEEEPEVVEPEEEEPEVVEPEEEEPYVPPEKPKPGAPWGLIGGLAGGLATAGGIGYWLWLWWKRRRREKANYGS